MSTPKKTNSVPPKNKKRDDFVCSKQAKQSSSAYQPNESTTTDNYATSASSLTIDKRTSLMADTKLQLDINATIQNHQLLLINKYLAEVRLNRDDDKSDSCDKVIQNTTSKVQAEINEGVRDLSTLLPAARNDLAKVIADAKEKIRICHTFAYDLNKDYTAMVGFMSEKMENIGQVHTNINEINQNTIDQQKHFDRESQLEEQELDKVNREIDFILKERNEIALRISDANKVIDEMTKAHAKQQKTNKRLKELIDNREREIEVNEESLAAVNNNVKECITEKTEVIKMIDEEEIKLKKEQAILMDRLDAAKEKYKKLCQEEVELTAKTASQEKLIARVKTANKNLRHDETANSEFEQKFSQLSVELKMITDENAEMQCSMDKQQQQWDDLKRVQEDILKKQQDHNELLLKLLSLKKENEDSMELISNTRKNINVQKSREETKENGAVQYCKRLRLSSNTTDDLERVEIVSNSSSLNIIDLGDLGDLEDFEIDNDLSM